MTEQNRKNNHSSKKHGKSDTARSRRRERRKEERRQNAMANSCENAIDECSTQASMTPSTSSYAPNKSRRQRSSSISTASTATCSTSISSLGDSCYSPEPKMLRPQHEIITKSSSSKTSRRNKSSSKSKARSSLSKPIVVEVEDIPESEMSRYVALDCEMVGVGAGGYRSALARVSIVNWDGDTIVDRHVKVEEPVTDYRTFVSGITQADLESHDALSFTEARELVCAAIQDKVVVGHALKNDFDVLQISHPWFLIRDTARYEPLMKPHPFEDGILIASRLRDLARAKLGLVIQEDGTMHDSIEDACAAMDLYKKARRKWEKAVEWKVNKTRLIIERQQKEALFSALKPAVTVL